MLPHMRSKLSLLCLQSSTLSSLRKYDQAISALPNPRCNQSLASYATKLSLHTHHQIQRFCILSDHTTAAKQRRETTHERIPSFTAEPLVEFCERVEIPKCDTWEAAHQNQSNPIIEIHDRVECVGCSRTSAAPREQAIRRACVTQESCGYFIHFLQLRRSLVRGETDG